MVHIKVYDVTTLCWVNLVSPKNRIYCVSDIEGREKVERT